MVPSTMAIGFAIAFLDFAAGRGVPHELLLRTAGLVEADVSDPEGPPVPRGLA